MKRALLAIVVTCLSALYACQSPPPIRPATPPPAATPIATPVPTAGAPAGGTPGGTDGGPAASAGSADEWTYSEEGRRDPFKTFLSEMDTGSNVLKNQCNTHLGRYELNELKLVAVVTGIADPVAMVEAPDGAGYQLRPGFCVGKAGGLVKAIHSGEVVVTELVTDIDGTTKPVERQIQLPKEPSVNLEE